MLRRLLRRHAWSLYRYYDNLLRLPPRAVIWRIYKRGLAEPFWARRAAGRPASPRVGANLDHALGGPQKDVAQSWLEGGGARHFCDQPSPVRTAELARKLCPDEVERTLARADEFMAGRFRLLEGKAEVRLDDPARPDWTANPLGDIEWPLALNRFRGYARCLSRASLYAGDRRYADRLLDLMDDWIRSNPRGRPMAWSSMEITLRSLEWNAALYVLRGSPALDAARLARIWGSLIQQLEHLRVFPEIELSDNHLIYNLAALDIAAIVWPQFRSAQRWSEWANQRLLHELRRQHWEDGFNVEQSTHYAAQVSRIYCETWAIARLNGNDIGEVEPFVVRFLDQLAGLLRPDGTLPLLSDAFTSFFEQSASHDVRTLLSWGGVVFDQPEWRRSAGRLTEEAVWMLGEQASTFNVNIAGNVAQTVDVSHLFLPTAGYYVTRCDSSAAQSNTDPRSSSSYLAFDIGPLGFPPVPAHGHADLLSFEFWHGGRPLVVDPGTFEYEPGEWAAYFRRTRAHATITVDGLDQSTQWGFARWVDLPDFTVHAAGWEGEIFWIDGSHGGYERLDEPIRHRRRLCWIAPHLIVIEDLLTGRGRHRFEQTFPLAHGVPCTRLSETAIRVADDGMHGMELRCLKSPPGLHMELPCGQKEPLIWGWSAPNYGFCEPATVVVFSVVAPAPVRFVTVLSASPLKEHSTTPDTWMTEDECHQIVVRPQCGFEVVETRPGKAARIAGIDTPGITRSDGQLVKPNRPGGWLISHGEAGS